MGALPRFWRADLPERREWMAMAPKMSPRSAACWMGACTVVAASLMTPTPSVAMQGVGFTRGATAALAASAPLADDERGSWLVAQVNAGAWQVSWRSPVVLPVTSDRPTIVEDGVAIGLPTVADDGRTVSVTVQSADAPDPDRLDVLLSGDRLDVTGRDGGDQAPALGRSTAGAVAGAVLDQDPATPGPYPVVTSDYRRAPVALAGMPEPIEMVGHVVEPTSRAATGPRPLVLFLHGRHDYCYDPNPPHSGGDWPCTGAFEEVPSHLGYDYIQRVLASQGFTTVSVRVNGINAQDYALDDGGADARARIIGEHLEHWVTLATAHQVDLKRVVLVGHSRGGEGVNRASLQTPLSAAYRIVGQVLIAPTDFGTQTAPYVPTTTLLPYCDGDVTDLQGQRFTDTARDLSAGDSSLKSSALVMGANHNYFNTEWTPSIAAAPAWDDWSGPSGGPCGSDTDARLSATEQQAVGKAWVVGAVQLFAKNAQQFLPLYDGSGATVASVGDADVRSHALGGGRVLRRPAQDTGLSLPVGAETQFCIGTNGPLSEHDRCGRGIEVGSVTPHWPESYERVPTRRAFEMSWSAPGQSGGMVLGTPLQLSGRRLELRTIVDPDRGDVRLRVRIADASGHAATLTPRGGGKLRALLRGDGLSKRWAQTVVVDPSRATGVNLNQVTHVDLIADSAKGRVWVEDLASAPSSLAAVPVVRLPLVSLGDLRRAEGDRPGTVTARLPFTISGASSKPGRMVALVVGQERGDVHRYAIDLAPGQTSGTILIDYQADRRDDYPTSVTQVAAWATSEVMTDDYLGELVVRDDDPTPGFSLTRVARSITEGQSAQFRVRIAAPVDYDTFIDARVVPGPGRDLTGRDVPLRWLRAHASEPGRPAPLYRLGVSLFEQLDQGERSLLLSVPVRKDGRAEQREAVTLRVRMNGRSTTRTIRVAPAR
jgi:dienelactone hydrolase